MQELISEIKVDFKVKFMTALKIKVDIKILFDSNASFPLVWVHIFDLLNQLIIDS